MSNRHWEWAHTASLAVTLEKDRLNLHHVGYFNIIYWKKNVLKTLLNTYFTFNFISLLQNEIIFRTKVMFANDDVCFLRQWLLLHGARCSNDIFNKESFIFLHCVWCLFGSATHTLRPPLASCYTPVWQAFPVVRFHWTEACSFYGTICNDLVVEALGLYFTEKRDLKCWICE